MGLDIVICGLALSSSWGNGQATTWRALIRALGARGHRVTFFERDQPWYRDNRDLPHPAFCRLLLYQNIHELMDHHGAITRNADLVICGSLVPEGIALNDWLIKTARGITAFYDIDAPITQAMLNDGTCEYITHEQARGFDIYLSATGGPMLEWLKKKYGIARPRPLYCSADPHDHRPVAATKRHALGYLGNYGVDRQQALDELLLKTALALPTMPFAIAGSGYPPAISWLGNVTKIGHLPAGEHAALYAGQNFTLNLSHGEMAKWGWSPSVRLFEATACGVPVITDDWPGLPEFFRPGDEMLVARTTEDVIGFLTGLDMATRNHISAMARARIAAQHTAHHRARTLESYIREVLRARKRVMAG